MTLTASQIRQARVLLGRSSPRLGKRVWLSFDKVLKAQDDEAIATVSELDIRTLWSTLEAAGVVLEPDGSVAPWLRGVS